MLFGDTFKISRDFQLHTHLTGYPIGLWFVFGFLVLSLGAACFLLMSLGPQVAPVSPVAGPRAGSSGEQRNQSMVFYGAIVTRTLGDWKAEREGASPEDITSSFEKSLPEEIYSLSQRVVAKHNHTLRARSLFNMAIALLIVGVFFLVHGLTYSAVSLVSTSGTPLPIPWTTTFGVCLAIVVFGLTASSAFDQFSKRNDMQALKGRAADSGPVAGFLHSTPVRVVAPAVTAAITVGQGPNGPLWVKGLGAAAAVLWVWSSAPLDANNEGFVRLIQFLSGLFAIVYTMAALLNDTPVMWRFVLAFAPIVCLETARFFTPEMRDLREWRRKRANERSALLAAVAARTVDTSEV